MHLSSRYHAPVLQVSPTHVVAQQRAGSPAVQRGLALGQRHRTDVEFIIAAGMPGQQLLQAGQEEADGLRGAGVEVPRWGGNEPGRGQWGRGALGGGSGRPGPTPHLAGVAGGCRRPRAARWFPGAPPPAGSCPGRGVRPGAARHPAPRSVSARRAGPGSTAASARRTGPRSDRSDRSDRSAPRAPLPAPTPGPTSAAAARPAPPLPPPPLSSRAARSRPAPPPPPSRCRRSARTAGSVRRARPDCGGRGPRSSARTRPAPRRFEGGDSSERGDGVGAAGVRRPHRSSALSAALCSSASRPTPQASCPGLGPAPLPQIAA